MEIIKNDKEKTEELCKEINKVFGHKKFEAQKKIDNAWYCVCNNYFDKINLTITRRAELELKMDKERIEKIYKAFLTNYNQFMIEGFKVYWNDIDQAIMVYINNRKSKYEVLIPQQEEYTLLRKGADDLIAHLRRFF